jgi:hypothetical protein
MTDQSGPGKVRVEQDPVVQLWFSTLAPPERPERTWWLAALITRWKLDSWQYGHRTSVSSPLSMISTSKNLLQERHLNS